MKNNESEVLEKFLLDIDCLKKLDEWKDNFNIFDILKITHTEIRHSNVLAWLLNPNENHHLGDAFLREFIKALVLKKYFVHEESLRLLTQNLYSFTVLREFNHMDLILVSNDEKTVYIIENKIFANESKNQLQNYIEISSNVFPDYTKIFVFLTPDGNESSKPDTWKPLSYEELIISLENVMDNAVISEEVKAFINNFIYSVRRNVMGEKDPKLVSICNEIYNKHREALNLIYQNVNIDKSQDLAIICGVLQEYYKNEKIILKNDNSLKFWTKRMDEYLPNLNEENSSRGTNYIYYYWLELESNKIAIHFEIGGKINDKYISESENKDIFNKYNTLINASIKIKNKKNSIKTDMHFKYKRLFTNKKDIKNDFDDKTLANAVRKLIDNALENENKLFKELEKK